MLGQCANDGREIERCLPSAAPRYFHKPKYCTAALALEHDLAKLYAIVENAYFVCKWTFG